MKASDSVVVSKRSNGAYEIRFGGVAKTVRADHLVLALPFTTLREVDLSGPGFSPQRLECIQRLGMGTNTKVLMQFEEPPHLYSDRSGDMVSDDPYLFTWDSTLRQPGRGSVIATFVGGRSSAVGLPATRAQGPSPRPVIEHNLRDVSRGGVRRDGGRLDRRRDLIDPMPLGRAGLVVSPSHNSLGGRTCRAILASTSSSSRFASDR